MTMTYPSKKKYSWSDVERMCLSICLQMYNDNWKPDYIVGITRGGNVPATIISNTTGIRCESLKVSLRDDAGESETNCWMSEDAFGYRSEPADRDGLYFNAISDPALRQNILIVDDINDTGATFNWIMNDWKTSCVPKSEAWNDIFGNNVRFAVLTDNLSSDFELKVNYSCDEVNKAEDDVWLVYPWENVGEF